MSSPTKNYDYNPYTDAPSTKETKYGSWFSTNPNANKDDTMLLGSGLFLVIIILSCVVLYLIQKQFCGGDDLEEEATAGDANSQTAASSNANPPRNRPRFNINALMDSIRRSNRRNSGQNEEGVSFTGKTQDPSREQPLHMPVDIDEIEASANNLNFKFNEVVRPPSPPPSHADIKRKQQKEKLRQKQQQQQLEPMSENKKLSKNRKAESTSGVSQKRRGLANLFSSKDYTASNNSSPKQNKKSMKSSTSYPHELVEQANQ